MIELTPQQIQAVSGAGFNPLSLIGTPIIQAVAAINGFFNLVAPIGQELNKLGPLVKLAHLVGDSLIFGASVAAAYFGYLLGGQGKIDYHLIKEWFR